MVERRAHKIEIGLAFLGVRIPIPMAILAPFGGAILGDGHTLEETGGQVFSVVNGEPVVYSKDSPSVRTPLTTDTIVNVSNTWFGFGWTATGK